jgi:predicted enzyme related to lactoylglutathione lyase
MGNPVAHRELWSKNAEAMCRLVFVVWIAVFMAGAAVAQEEAPMRDESQDRRIDYIEIPSTDIEASKAFYGAVFGWEFQDWGPDYSSFNDGRTDGGFRYEETIDHGGALVVMFAVDLEAVEASVREHGGEIVKEIFSFPGGRRFEFTDPSGNHLAVWTDRGVE